jgi:hypothetical protein
VGQINPQAMPQARCGVLLQAVGRRTQGPHRSSVGRPDLR